MIYEQGQIYESKKEKWELLTYLGEFRRKSNGAKIFKAVDSPYDGREHVYYEVWKCLNLNTGKYQDVKVPVYIYVESLDESVNTDRRATIDDNNEVTSLLDHYSCWLTGKRDEKNFHLDIINERHNNQIKRLRELDSQEHDHSFSEGIRLKLIQKENPNSLTKRRYQEWSKKYPKLHETLVNAVYINNNNGVINNTKRY